MASAAAPLLSGQRSLVQRQLLDVGAQLGQGFSLQQPQTKVSVAVGETLTLRCTTSGIAGPGPVKWLKGWDSGNKTIYDQTTKDPSSRVMRAMTESNTDFTIHIRSVQPDDAATYYCVKFVKSDSGVDEVFQRGSGTEVSVHERALVSRTGAVAVVLCFLLLLLLGLFVALCVYRRKRQGGLGSPCPARTVAMGSFSSVPLRCCTGTPGTPSEVLEAESSHLPSQQSSKEENDIHYADLQPLPPAPRRGRSPGTALTEYASLRVAAK
ncbi:signal-regulatory protein delta-like isoform X2 [Hirundo rustica]|uniref:signal-regulatory protein delta-like isoform X2 n=1 Tax=Hirundo rustica TaxID=43150 RepID=UPI001A93B419|nr:signal-regulatory protein delta-like isoform X2 [Hirundo rustica]